MKDLYEVMTSHRSIRKYLDKDLAQGDLERILQAAIHGPSSINGQQFSIVVVRDQARKDKLAELAGDQAWIAQAPVFLVFVADYSRVATALEAQGLEFANIRSIEASLVSAVDCGIAFSNAMNLAESLGYGICPIGAVRRDPAAVIDLLDLPKYVYPIVGMCLGWPDQDPGLKPRFPLDIMVHEETYTPASSAQLGEYDQVISSYLTERTAGAETRGWSDGTAAIYTNIYYPKVLGTMREQGYLNEA